MVTAHVKLIFKRHQISLVRKRVKMTQSRLKMMNKQKLLTKMGCCFYMSNECCSLGENIPKASIIVSRTWKLSLPLIVLPGPGLFQYLQKDSLNDSDPFECLFEAQFPH